MTSRPAIDPSADYTVLSATAARRQLAFESGLSRAATAQMGLEELQTTIARAMPPEIGAKVVVASDKGFARMQDAFHAETRRIVGGDVDVDAPVMSRTKAEEALREHVTDLPDGEPTINLEDAVAGLRGVPPLRAGGRRLRAVPHRRARRARDHPDGPSRRVPGQDGPVTSDHREAREIERHHAARSTDARRRLGLSGTGPRLDATIEEDGVSLELMGRTRTLATRRFRWDAARGDGLWRQLGDVAAEQALRAAIARGLGLGGGAMPVERLLVDRSQGAILAREHGEHTLLAIAMEARGLDIHETVPCDRVPRAGRAMDQSFTVSPCGATQGVPVGPSVKTAATNLAQRGDARILMDQGVIQVWGAGLPDALCASATGRRLADVVDTGEREVADRVVAEVEPRPGGVTIRLVHDLVEIRSLFR